MKKERITFEQVAAGAILKFGKLESADMTLLMKEISKIALIDYSEDADLDKYFVMGDGSILLNEKYVHSFYRNSNDSFKSMLGNGVVAEYFRNLNILEFVLRKIKLIGLGFVVKDEIDKIFSKKQIAVMNELYKREFIEDYKHNDDIYGEYDAVRVTQKGKVSLFLVDYRDEVKEFLSLVRSVGYSEAFIRDFMMKQDYDGDLSEILTLDNFEVYREKIQKEEDIKIRTYGKK